MPGRRPAYTGTDAMKIHFVVLILAALVGAPTTMTAQDKPPSVFRATNYTDAIVTDASGHSITDLQPADLRLNVDGESRPLSHLAYVSPVAGTIRSDDAFPLLLKPDDIHRTFIFLVDDLSLSFDALTRVRAALDNYVNHQMDGRDHAAVIRTASGSGVLETITSDKTPLLAAIARLRYTHLVRPEAVQQELQFVLDGLGRMSGRKSVVVFSESARSSLETSVVNLAARAGAVVYLIDPRDGPPPAPTATGGLNFANADVAASLTRVLEDQQGYYLLAFPVGELAPRTVQIETAREGAHVRTRGGPVMIVQPSPPLRDESPADELARSLFAPFTASSMNVSVAAVSLLLDDGEPAVHIDVLLDMRTVATTLHADGSRTGSLELDVALFAEGNSRGHVSRAVDLHLSDSEYRRFLRTGTDVALDVPLPPGVYEVRAVVRDGTNGHLGYARQSVAVPHFKDGKLHVSEILLRPAKTNELDQANDVGDRIFPPGVALTYSYQVVDGAAANHQPPLLERILRLHRHGRVTFEAEPVPLKPSQDADSSALLMTGTMTLGASIEPGTYLLELGVREQGEHTRTASQFVDFTVR